MEGTKKIRVTKAQRYEDIKAMLNGEAVQFETDLNTALDFIDKEIASLQKKNDKTNKTPTKNQKENEVFKDRVYEYMMSVDTGVTCTDVLKAIPELLSTPRTRAVMKILIDAGLVESYNEKQRTHFRIK